ncbi:MAG: hypothetical protein ACNI27_12030 [Desulfovibrio sp.]
MPSDPLVEEFYSEVSDKYYPQIMEGIELIENDKRDEGLEIIARPLHTIKGVTGFMEGFGEISTFTHKVESYLQDWKSGTLNGTGNFTTIACRAIIAIFDQLETIMETGGIDAANEKEILSYIEAARQQEQEEDDGDKECIEEEFLDDKVILLFHHKRLHMPEERKAICAKLKALSKGANVVMDMRNVLSVNATTLSDIAAYANHLSLSAINMNKHVRGTLYSWGFDQHILDTFTDGDI